MEPSNKLNDIIELEVSANTEHELVQTMDNDKTLFSEAAET